MPGRDTHSAKFGEEDRPGHRTCGLQGGEEDEPVRGTRILQEGEEDESAATPAVLELEENIGPGVAPDSHIIFKQEEGSHPPFV